MSASTWQDTARAMAQFEAERLRRERAKTELLLKRSAQKKSVAAAHAVRKDRSDG